MLGDAGADRAVGRPQPAAGVTCVASTTGRILLLRRSPLVTQPGLWSCPAGRIDRGERPLEAAVRELSEEAGYAGPLHLHGYWKDGEFHHFVAETPRQFRPRLNWESDGAVWCLPGELPQPVHPGMLRMLSRLMS
jgi:8-oxo-dGTP pyrophosphatase MutT (NUDIX family)